MIVETLSGEEVRIIRNTLLKAFSQTKLSEMVFFTLGYHLDEIVADGPLEQMVFDLIRLAEARGEVKKLIAGAHKENLGNDELRKLARKYGVEITEDEDILWSEREQAAFDYFRHKYSEHRGKDYDDESLLGTLKRWKLINRRDGLYRFTEFGALLFGPRDSFSDNITTDVKVVAGERNEELNSFERALFNGASKSVNSSIVTSMERILN